jgi:U3 small nucleolar RNA-associated protein 15
MGKDYVPLQSLAPPRPPEDFATEALFFKGFRPWWKGEPGETVVALHSNPAEPEELAVGRGTRVDFVNLAKKQVVKSLSRLKLPCMCVRYRADGKLMVVGDEGGLAQVLQVSTRTSLRRLNHSEGVTCATFPSSTHVLTGSRDKLVKLWDLAGEELAQFAHEDYVQCVEPLSEETFATGASDACARVWDTRQPEPVITLKHSEPVTSLAVLGSGSVLVTASGPALTFWDIPGGGRALQTVVLASKALTSICVGPQGTLIVGALDGNVAQVTPSLWLRRRRIVRVETCRTCASPPSSPTTISFPSAR